MVNLDHPTKAQVMTLFWVYDAGAKTSAGYVVLMDNQTKSRPLFYAVSLSARCWWVVSDGCINPSFNEMCRLVIGRLNRYPPTEHLVWLRLNYVNPYLPGVTHFKEW